MTNQAFGFVLYFCCIASIVELSCIMTYESNFIISTGFNFLRVLPFYLFSYRFCYRFCSIGINKIVIPLSSFCSLLSIQVFSLSGCFYSVSALVYEIFLVIQFWTFCAMLPPHPCDHILPPFRRLYCLKIYCLFLYFVFKTLPRDPSIAGLFTFNPPTSRVYKY